MACPEPITPLNEGTSSQNAKSIIEGHVSALKEILKEPDNQNLIKPILLDFDDIQDVSDKEIKGGMKRKAKVGDEDLSKSFKEVLKCLFTRRIVELSSPGHRMFQQTLDGKARAWFDKLLPGSIDNWSDLQEKFQNRFGMLKACDKDPTEISKILQKANETLPHFKERYVSESNAISNIPELMQISSFMSSHKCLELAKRFSNNIPKTMDEMLKRVDDYLRSKEAFRSMEFQRRDALVQWAEQNDRNQRFSHGNNHRRQEHNLNLRFIVKHSLGNHNNRTPVVPALTSAVGGSTQQRGKGGQRSNGSKKAKVINMVQCYSLNQKRKTTMTDEEWMNVPIIFPPVLAQDHSKDALVVEAEVEGYLVRRIHIDEGASVKIMFEHCFNMLHPSIRSKLVKTQTAVSGFLGEQVKPLGKIELNDDEIPNSLGGSNSTIASVSGTVLSVEGSNKLNSLLKRNTDIFAWEPSNMTGMPKRIIKHSLSVDPLERAGIVRPVKYPTWISNPVLVKKTDETWRICIDFKNVNAACPKDYYPLSEIDSKIEAVMGFPLKCFLDAYKGATYQRLVDRAFKTQIERNLEAYVDDMVIKSMSERDILADIAETFDNLRWINMKLNPKKCSFGVAKEKFLGEIQSLAGKLAALNRFLSRSTEKSLPFFKTLKDITKANKHDYRWTEKAENAFQDLKKMILDLPALTTPFSNETLFVYLAISREAASAVLLVVRQGKQHPIHYVSRTLHDAERNYAPLEKIGLAAALILELAPYVVELGAYNITYEPRNAIKGQAEYEALPAGLRIAKKIGVEFVSVKVDSKLVASQINGNYEACKENMIWYLNKAKEYIGCFKNFKIQNIPWNKNQKADVLSKLASLAFNQHTKEILVEMLDVPSMDVQEINAVVEKEGEPWMTPIINGLERGTWPEDQNEARAL
nr:hypothetical protein [Tanacetum cinerariifolium]